MFRKQREWDEAHAEAVTPEGAPDDVLRWAAEGMMEYLDEGLANGSCAFCCEDNERKEHVEGCWCDVLQKALRGVRD